MEGGVYFPVRCFKLPAPRAVIELIICVCNTSCKTRCSGLKNGLPCTPLCKCHGSDYENIITSGFNEYDENDEFHSWCRPTVSSFCTVYQTFLINVLCHVILN